MPYRTTNISNPTWTQDSTSGFPTLLKHGVVKPVTQIQYNAIRAKWS